MGFLYSLLQQCTITKPPKSKLQIQNGRCVQVQYILDMLQYLSTSTQVVRVEIRRDTCCRWLVRPVASTADSCKTNHHTAVVASSPASLLLALLSATLPGLSHISLFNCITVLDKYVDISRINKKLFINHNLSKT